jgi:large conductance mechanosensitive channel
MQTEDKKPQSRRNALLGRGGQQIHGFVDFIREQGVIGLAIGFVIGAAAATVVKSLVDNVFMPPIGVLIGSADGIKSLTLSLGTYHGKEALLHYGQFLNDLINFVIIALVIYIIVRLLRLDRADKKKE